MIIGLGDVLRQLRVKDKERLLDMADRLSVSPAFLSSIEHGKKKPPADFLARLQKEYILSAKMLERLKSELDRANSGVMVKSAKPLARETAAVFARKINSLSDDKLREIQEILKAKDKK